MNSISTCDEKNETKSTLQWIKSLKIIITRQTSFLDNCQLFQHTKDERYMRIFDSTLAMFPSPRAVEQQISHSTFPLCWTHSLLAKKALAQLWNVFVSEWKKFFVFLHGIYLVNFTSSNHHRSHMMDESQDVDDNEQWKLHRCVFDNDLQALSEALKSNINLIDKKVKFFSLSLPASLFRTHRDSSLFARISMETRHSTWLRCWVGKVSSVTNMSSPILQSIRYKQN